MKITIIGIELLIFDCFYKLNKIEKQRKCVFLQHIVLRNYSRMGKF